MKLGLVTYQLARDWDLDRLLDTCAAHGFLGVELRTTHAHGVETTLSPEARRRVRNRFEQSPVELVEMGSLFEYHMADRDEVRRHVQGTKEYVRLAADGTTLTLVVSDDGEGLPADFGLETSANLGLNIVRSMVERDLRGTFRIYRDQKTRAVIHFGRSISGGN